MEKNRKKMGIDSEDLDTSDLSIEDINSNHEEEVTESEESVLIKKLTTDLEEQKDKYIRLVAEFQNFRTRTSKENLELKQTAGKEVIIPLLDVLDDCDRAEKQMQETSDVNQIKEGVLLVFNKFRKLLQMKGLKVMDSLNTEFEVEKHEAITEIPVTDEKMKGKVVDEIQRGYYLNDKLIRFAKVIVGK